jgi:hypothetical protein
MTERDSARLLRIPFNMVSAHVARKAAGEGWGSSALLRASAVVASPNTRREWQNSGCVVGSLRYIGFAVLIIGIINAGVEYRSFLLLVVTR